MSKNISNLLNSAGDAYNNQLAQTRGLVSKWNKTGLLEGIDQEYDKSGMAVLLENQARQLIDEASNTSSGTASKEQWSGVALPLVRRVFGEIAAKDFVSVQPMNLPSGLVFFLDFKYGDDNGTQQTSGADLMGNTSKSDADAEGGLYGAGKFGYSDATKNVSLAAGKVIPASASWAELGFASALSASVSDGSAIKLSTDVNNLTNGTFTIDLNTLRATSVAPVETGHVYGSHEVYSAYNFATDANGVKTTDTAKAVSASFFLAQTTTPAAGRTSVAVVTNVSFSVNTTADLRNDFEMAGADVDKSLATQDVGIPQIDVQLRSEAIVAKTRKLKAAWSPEFAQDLNAYHSIDAEAELTSMLSEYISMEIDLEIIDMLIQNANTTDHWSAALGESYDGTSAYVSPTAAEAYTQFTWFQTLGTKIQKVSNKIHQKTMRGGANFLVTSPEVATILESIPGYAADTAGDATSFAMGVQKVGALNSRFTVYKNPYMKEATILLGFRGTQFLETGAVYAPYIPLIMTPLVYDPTNFTPRKGVMTRYAKKMVRPEFYGKIHIAGLNRV